MELKDKLRQLRKDKGLSQAQLAELLFVSRSTVAKWENGLGLPNPESVERLEQEFGITKEDIATNEPETVIVEKNRRLRRFGETAAILGTVVILVLMCILPFWIEKVGYGVTPEMAAGYAPSDDPMYIDTGDYRIFYFGWPQHDENGEDSAEYFVAQGIRPVKKHFWGYTRAGNQAYKVFDEEDKCVAYLHTVKGENGYYNFLKWYPFADAQYLYELDQVRVNGSSNPYIDGIEPEDGEICEVQKGFFFVSSEQVSWLHIGNVYLNVDTMFVSNSLV